METAVLQASTAFGMHPSRLNDGYTYSNPGSPSMAASASTTHAPSSSYATASGSRPAYPRRRSAQTPSGLVGPAASSSNATPRSSAFPQPIFDPDSPFSQTPQGRTIVSPEKQRHVGPSVLRSPDPALGEGTLERPWGEDALGSPWATRPPAKIRLEDVAEGQAKRTIEGAPGGDVYGDEQGQPIVAVRRGERGRGRNVILDPTAPYEGGQQQMHQQQQSYAPVAGPSRGYPTHHRGQSDDLHNRHHYRASAPTTPSSYYVPTLQTMAPPLSPSATLTTHYQPPRVTSPLPGGGDWGQFVHAELFEEGNSQEEINPYGPGEAAGSGVAMDGGGLGQQQLPGSSSAAHAFHHPRPRPVLSAHDLEPTPLLEPHSDTSPTFSLPSRSQPGTPASFGVPEYAEHHLHPAYSSSSHASLSGGQYQQFQPYNPSTLDSFNPAQMHLPPSSFTFTSVAPTATTGRVPDYRGHRRVKSIESVVSDFGSHVGGGGGGVHDAIPEEYDEPSYSAHGGQDDYALNNLVKQVHIQHSGRSTYRAPSRLEQRAIESASQASSRAPSPTDSYRPQSSTQTSPYQEQAYPQPPQPAAPSYSPAMGTHPYGQPMAAAPVILVPHGQPPPPGMVAVQQYPTSSGNGYLQPHGAPPPVAPSPTYQPTFTSGSPYSTHSPVMGGSSEAGSSQLQLSPVLPSQAAPPPSGPPSKETLATRRRSNRRGGSLSITSTKDASGQPQSLSASLSASDLSSAPSQASGDPPSAHYHPYARPSPTVTSSSSFAAPPSATKPAIKKRVSITGSTPSKRSGSSSSSRAVDKSAMAALIETLYEPLDADHGGSESASPPEQLDYDTATGGKGKGKEELKFRCLVEDCDRAFPRRSAIIHHIQMHLSDKPFVCPVPGCSASFVRQHDLRRHERIHSETKQFNCPCGKGFTRGDALVRHRQRGICIGSTVPPSDP